MQQIGQDPRVRYAPDLGVWTVDMQTMTYTGGAMETLAAAMHYAREAGEMPECTCFPEVSTERGPMAGGVYASPPMVHKVFRHGAFTIYGHGTVEAGDHAPSSLNAMRCPLANAGGEAEAERLARKDSAALYEATRPFPTLPDDLAPVEPGTKAPAVWEGDAIDLGRGTLPARHVHAATRADMARLASLRGEVARLDRAARDAKRAAEDAPAAARREVATKAAAGEQVDAAAVTALVRQRQEEAQAAQAVADGTRDALDHVRRDIASGIASRRDEWLAYLHAQASHGLARLDLVLAELDASLADLAEIDRVRQTVERPSSSNLFTAGSSLAMGDAVASVQQARERAAKTLASLARHTAKAEKATAGKARAAR